MKKNQRIKKNVEKRTTQPRTACGRSYPHDWHGYRTEKKQNKKVCDGVLR